MSRAFFPEHGGIVATLKIADPNDALVVAEAQVYVSGNNEVTPVPAAGGQEAVGQLTDAKKGSPDDDSMSVVLFGYAVITTSKVTSAQEPAAGDVVYLDADANTYSNVALGNQRIGICLAASATVGYTILLQS